MGGERAGEGWNQEDSRQEIAQLLGDGYDTSKIPADLLEPFNHGDVVIAPGRQGGRTLVVKSSTGRNGDTGYRYLEWR